MTTEIESTESETSDSETSARSLFTSLLRARAEEYPELSAGEVAELVANDFIQRGYDVLQNYFVTEGISILKYNLRTAIVRTRSAIYQTFDLRPETIAIEEPAPVRSPSIFQQIREWREYDPVEKRGRLLLTLTRTDLQNSAQRDAVLAVHHGWKAAFKLKLAEGLPDDTTTVEAFYSPEQLLKILAESKTGIKKQLLNGNLKIKI